MDNLFTRNIVLIWTIGYEAQYFWILEMDGSNILILAWRQMIDVRYEIEYNATQENNTLYIEYKHVWVKWYNNKIIAPKFRDPEHIHQNFGRHLCHIT